MRLPVEVSEGVIDQANDNTASLRHLSLTCTTFLPRARYHLFHSIAIRTMEQMEGSRDFLDAHPWLLPLVHKVVLTISVSKSCSERNIRLLDVVPVHIFTQLPNLRAWSMGNNRFSFSGEAMPSLSLQRSVLQCYRRYGRCIHDLELSLIQFDGISDFTGLVSAFTNIHTLTCRNILFRKVEENNFSQENLATNGLVQSLEISALQLDTFVDICAIEYLLANCAVELSNIRLDIRNHDSKYFERLEQSMTWPSRLSSLTLVVHIPAQTAEDPNKSLSEILCGATRILERVQRSRLTDVRVEVKADPIAVLGSCLAYAGPSLEACNELEEALLAFPNPRVLVHEAVHGWRAGRSRFWRPTVERAFPRLTKRALLIFKSVLARPGALDILGHEDRVTCLITSHDGERVATASGDGTIIVWDAVCGTVLLEWLAHERCVNALALSPDSRRLLSAGCDHSLVAWAIDTGVQKAAELRGHTDGVTACTWSPDGGLIASVSRDGMACVWDGGTFQQRDMLKLPFDPEGHRPFEPPQVQFSPDARYLAWISGFDCWVWRPLTGNSKPKRLRSHPENRSDVYTFALAFDPESRRIATTHANLTRDPDACVVRIWDVNTGAALDELLGPSEPATRIAFSPDGRSLMFTSDDGSARVWDAESGKLIRLFKAAEFGTARACFSPDREHIAAGTHFGGQVRLWRIDDGSCVGEFACHVSKITHIAFSPDGNFLASADCEGMVHIQRLSEFI